MESMTLPFVKSTAPSLFTLAPLRFHVFLYCIFIAKSNCPTAVFHDGYALASSRVRLYIKVL